MELRLVQGTELNNNFSVPEESTADVSFRRLQRFQVRPKKTYHYRFERGDRTIQEGQVAADSEGMLVVPSLKITSVPGTLKVF